MQLHPLGAVLAAFLILGLSDGLKLRGRMVAGHGLFALGVLLLLAGLAWAALAGERTAVSPLARVLWLALSALGLALLLYALFLALPPRATYLGDGAPTLQDSGLYALCRHPGALFLPLWLLPLALGLGSGGLLRAALLASFLNLLYVWVQDRLVFPRTIPHYRDYQRRVPALLPTRRSLQAALRGLKQKRD